MNIDRLQNIASKQLARYRHAQRTVRDEKKFLREYKAAHGRAVKIQALTQALAADFQNRCHEQITKVVTSALQSVFQKPYRFSILFTRKRGKTEAKMRYFLGENEIDPVEEDGGGLLDIAAFALRLSAIALATPRRRKWIAFDEPFRNVNGDDYRQRTVELVESIAKDFGFQLVIATGLEWLKVRKVVEL